MSLLLPDKILNVDVKGIADLSVLEWLRALSECSGETDRNKSVSASVGAMQSALPGKALSLCSPEY